MSPRSCLRTRSARRRDQSGIALILVLAVIAFTSLVIGALLTLLLTTVRVTDRAAQEAREMRAADGAIDTAINHMRTDHCQPSRQPHLGTQLFDQGTAATGDDVQVDVTCRPVGGSTWSTDQVRIVGTSGYRGSLAWSTDCAADATSRGCLAWTAALGSVPPGLADRNVGLIHGGHEPLQFAAGVSVRTGAAALRNPAEPAAITVGGEYAQGDPGLLATADEPCGMLAGEPGDGAGRIDDADRRPVCDDDAIKSLRGDPTANVSGLVAPTGHPAIPVPTTCSGPVVSFGPGTYGAADTDAVSRLTDGSDPACRNRTFHFTPGVYAFEGARVSFGDPGSAYVFGSPASWSTDAGVAAVPALVADPDAQLCDPDAQGTSLVINGWTELVHTAGRVAICPARPVGAGGELLDAHPAIYQQTAVPTGVEVVSLDTAMPGVGNPITLPFRCRPAAAGRTYPSTTDIDGSGRCRPQRRHQLRLATDGRGPVGSLHVLLTGHESDETPNNLVERRQSRFLLYGPADQLLCQTDFVRGIPNGRLTSLWDLRQLPGSCSTAALDQSQLDGARIVVDHQMDITVAWLGPNQLLNITAAEVEVNAVDGLAGTVSPTASWNGAGNARTPGSPVATPVMPAGCTDLACPYPDPGRTVVNVADRNFVHELELSDFEFPALFDPANPELDPSLGTLRAVVRVVPSNGGLPSSWPQLLRDALDPENFLIPVDATLELRAPSGARCISHSGGLNSDQELSFDLFDIDHEHAGAPDCNLFVFQHASELRDVSLTLRFSMPCVPNYLNGVPWECMRRIGFYNPWDTSPVWQLRPPDIDHVRLTTVTDTYAGSPPNSTITIDADAAAGRTSFNAHGHVWMPLTDLDLHWEGAATVAPLVLGDLVLHGLASRMSPGASMGVVCCGPPDSRTVELSAWIDGRERLLVRVDFTDVVTGADGTSVFSPGHSVDVLEYRRCGGGGCESQLGAPGGPGPPAVEQPP